MTKDSRNPAGSDIIAERLRTEEESKAPPKKKRNSLISFEVSTHKPKEHPRHTAHPIPTAHPKPVSPASPSSPALPPSPAAKREHKEKAEKLTKPAAKSSHGWKRIAVWVFIILLVMWYFTNNYMKNVKIEELQSANSEFAQSYEVQAKEISDLKTENSRLKGGS